MLTATSEQRNELFVSFTQKIGFSAEILEKNFWEDAENVFFMNRRRLMQSWRSFKKWGDDFNRS